MRRTLRRSTCSARQPFSNSGKTSAAQQANGADTLGPLSRPCARGSSAALGGQKHTASVPRSVSRSPDRVRSGLVLGVGAAVRRPNGPRIRPMKLEDLEAAALQLEPRSRARLAERLLESLDDLSPDDNTRNWAEEAPRRRDGRRHPVLSTGGRRVARPPLAARGRGPHSFADPKPAEIVVAAHSSSSLAWSTHSSSMSVAAPRPSLRIRQRGDARRRYPAATAPAIPVWPSVFRNGDRRADSRRTESSPTPRILDRAHVTGSPTGHAADSAYDHGRADVHPV